MFPAFNTSDPKRSSFPTEGPAPNQARSHKLCPISLLSMAVEEPQQTVMWNNFLCGFTRGWTQPDDIRSAMPDPVVPTSLGRKRVGSGTDQHPSLFAYNRPLPLGFQSKKASNWSEETVHQPSASYMPMHWGPMHEEVLHDYYILVLVLV